MTNEATMTPIHSTQSPRTPGLLGKLLAFVLSAVFFALAFMFSLAALAVVAVVGLLFAGWLWWKTRALRRQVQGATAARYRPGNVIDGEVIRREDSTAGSDKLLP